MAVQTFLALCALALIQCAMSCPCGKKLNLGNSAGVSSTGGKFPAASASPASPDGISVLSDNAYEGQLSLAGNLPFLGTVALEGLLPSRGAGLVSYGCGNGNVGITSELGSNTGIAKPGTYQPGPGALSCGCGLGRL